MTILKKAIADITQLKLDAIVNSANTSLSGGGGVCGAIFLAAGNAELEAACERIRTANYPNGLPTGEAVITAAFKLPTKWIIHTVGPIWYGGTQNEPTLLANCYRNSLVLASQHNIRTIAFPSISTNIFRYPKDQADEVAERTVKDFVAQNPTAFDEIWLINFGMPANESYIMTDEESL